jgi:hypothetical protein
VVLAHGLIIDLLSARVCLVAVVGLSDSHQSPLSLVTRQSPSLGGAAGEVERKRTTACLVSLVDGFLVNHCLSEALYGVITGTYAGMAKPC